MIRIYCLDHHSKEGLCPECAGLVDYAMKRIDHCPFSDDKPACSHCTVHCYSPAKREQIREVMRYSGKKVLLYNPYLALLHLLKTLKKEKKLHYENSKV
jgi:hypothetical protein